MNLGIITVIFNFCCVTDSIVFYYIFKEKLTKAQLFGVSILLISAYFISVKPAQSTTTYPHFPKETEEHYNIRILEIEENKNYNSMCAIFSALICTLFFSARDVILRYYRINKHYPAFELSLDSLTIYSFGCVLFAIYTFCW